jgi:hypothetical protein
MLNEHGHSVALWHHISQVAAWTLGMIALLLGGFNWLRQNPQVAKTLGFSPSASAPSKPSSSLLNRLMGKPVPQKSDKLAIKIESREIVEGKNSLVVALVGTERFLLSCNHDGGLSMLSKLSEPLPSAPSNNKVTDTPTDKSFAQLAGVASPSPQRPATASPFSLKFK